MGRGSSKVNVLYEAARSRASSQAPIWLREHRQNLLGFLRSQRGTENLIIGLEEVQLFSWNQQQDCDLATSRLLEDVKPLRSYWPTNLQPALTDLINVVCQSLKPSSEAEEIPEKVLKKQIKKLRTGIDEKLKGEIDPKVFLSFQAAEAALNSVEDLFANEEIDQRRAFGLMLRAKERAHAGGDVISATAEGCFNESRRLGKLLSE